ncbi:MAG: V-type ATPase 116kDa subunit family protein [Bacteroides sp.]|jgi:V/A-type H+-transporting ATPase subunit I|nr:V-type ATPase 116kDa subunit family protein [Bacteroides sp.]
MKKYSFLVYHKDYLKFLEDMRQLGVLHLIERQKDVPDSVLERYDLINKVNGVVKFLLKREIENPSPKQGLDGKEAFEGVDQLQQELENKHQQLSVLRKEISYSAPWGDFTPETIQKLKDEGLEVKFYTVSARKFEEEWLQQYPIEVVGQHAGLYYLILVKREEDVLDLELEEMRQPERPISELNFYKQKLNEEIEAIQAKFDQHASESLEAIQQYLLQLKEDLHFERVLENTVKEADEKVMLLEGWVPEEKKEDLVAFLATNDILYVEEKATQEEKPPVLLKNKEFSEKFEMLGQLYSLPKYGELDLTPFFAPFYMLFFGFCLGDAGYGILMAILALVFKKKVSKPLKPVLGLVFYLGLSTILFGLIGGTFFGIPLYETGLPVYSTLAERFKAEGTDINNLLFYLALLFGGVQIIFGLFIKAVNETKQFGWGFALGTLGWILLLVGGITLYLISMFSNIPLENLKIAQYILLGVSGLLILPLNNLGRNVFMNIGSGLWNTYNMVTGLLGDLLSYIRLFALGISSAILGLVFNSLAVQMSGDIPVLNILIMVVILVIGHSINIFMSGLGAFVHPLRLTFVEFYKNAGFTGGGKKYEPFKKLT